ncbi:hypothetical protein DEO72_LG5g1705 [Vigna unguiculata]|uniref:Secreted protein n=1 Tax=Vigna unguiculata TaxID=3917 RepID=A0A4D6LX71_VIGUN|nr:hypothetical protein DEO72_LG5g1705 [Vigna unguiculata]
MVLRWLLLLNAGARGNYASRCLMVRVHELWWSAGGGCCSGWRCATDLLVLRDGAEAVMEVAGCSFHGGLKWCAGSRRGGRRNRCRRWCEIAAGWWCVAVASEIGGGGCHGYGRRGEN